MKTYIENPNPQLYNLLKWLNGCTSKDPTHLSLQAINIKNRFRLEATNGFVAVVAILEAPIKFYADLDDGQWFIESITKKLAVLVRAEEITFPDISVILNTLHLVDSHAFACVNPAVLAPAMAGFERASINIYNERAGIEIVLNGDNFPDGTYIATVMPLWHDHPTEGIMTKAFEKLVSDKPDNVL